MLPPLSDGRRVLMLQLDLDGAAVAGIVAFFMAVWDVRAMCRRGVPIANLVELEELIITAVKCPWLMKCCATKSKKERRADRVREPEAAPGAVIYRSDGASRGQGTAEERMAGWGAAVWVATEQGSGIGPPAASSRGSLGSASNNVAEYVGLLKCMERALRKLDSLVLFEVDSMLLARQLARHWPWACRADSLKGLHRRCADLGELLARNGVEWDIRHVYREFNQVADALANQAVDEQTSDRASAEW